MTVIPNVLGIGASARRKAGRRVLPGHGLRHAEMPATAPKVWGNIHAQRATA